MKCDACGQTHWGLSFLIPSDAWAAISTDGVRYLCPWCASDRLRALGLDVTATINVCLPGLNGTNESITSHFEAIDHYLARIAHLERKWQ